MSTHRNCPVPITSWQAKVRAHYGQAITQPVEDANRPFICACGKRWSKRDRFGGRTLLRAEVARLEKQ